MEWKYKCTLKFKNDYINWFNGMGSPNVFGAQMIEILQEYTPHHGQFPELWWSPNFVDIPLLWISV